MMFRTVRLCSVRIGAYSDNSQIDRKLLEKLKMRNYCKTTYLKLKRDEEQ